MAIAESQLDTWSKQGSVIQSASTYETIRTVLNDPSSGYFHKSFEVFLQGSYGNDTNIYAESDVDVVIRLDSTFRYNLDDLADLQKQTTQQTISPATYTFEEFKAAVVSHLRAKFGSAVTVGNKAITIEGNATRRKTDVIVCYEYRRYRSGSDYVSGIVFPTPSGEIINYPKQHSANLTSQHQLTSSMLKPMVRILKNMRCRMVEKKILADGVAPSYYIEGMFYNVPKEKYVRTSFGDSFCNGINWLTQTNRSELVCANWQYYLLGNSNVQWNDADFDKFLSALCAFWNAGG